MARNLNPKCKQCRREGMKLFLKGERCLTDKCGVERRSYPPGEHGRGRIKQSEYLLQLREKQKARRFYGLLEKQFRTYYDKATRGTGVSISSRSGHFSTLPVSPSWSAWSHGATAAVRSVASRMICSAVEPDLRVTTSSGRTW